MVHGGGAGRRPQSAGKPAVWDADFRDDDPAPSRLFLREQFAVFFQSDWDTLLMSPVRHRAISEIGAGVYITKLRSRWPLMQN